VIGRRVVIASSPNIMQVVLDLRAGTGGKNVTSMPGYRQARQAAGADAAAMVYANTAVLKIATPVATALEGGKEPLTALLAAPVIEAVARSTWLAAVLRAKGDSLRLDVVTDGTIDPGGAGPCPTWPCPARSPRSASTATCTASTQPRTSCSPSGPAG
jgi:hypothetical protein